MTMPIELYRFVENTPTPMIWTVTSADDKTVHNEEMYLPIAIGRDEIQSKNELSKSNITVTVGIDNEMGRRWLKTSIDSVIGLTVFTKDLETLNVMVAWKGRLASIRPNTKSIQLIFESVFTSLRRPGLRRKYQRNCPHVLYGNDCKVDKSLHEQLYHIVAVTGVNVQIFPFAETPLQNFKGGMIEGTDGQLRFIVAHVDDIITLSRPLESIPVGSVRTLYPGCDRSLIDCKEKFNNTDNNGAFPYIPLKNPFGGSSIV